ncbi:MAG TPA: glycosyltransferase family protein [Terriglobales bacterium]
MKIVTIIQARMGSTRLPGKVMLEVCGKSVLARVFDRVRRSRLAGEVVVATTVHAADDILVGECQRLGVEVFRGSEDDVLDRYYWAARQFSADAIVRICSDCPLIDSEIVDRTIECFLNVRVDYASNALDRTYPRGLDVEVMTLRALYSSWQQATVFYQRSHVTPYIYQNSELFRIARVRSGEEHGELRWTLDTPEDLAFIRAVYERMSRLDEFGWRDVLHLLERQPELLELNRHIRQKALCEG